MAENAIAAEMTFAGDHLVFGAGTRLAKLGAPLDESRRAALLTSAYGGPIEASRLTHVRRAVETWREGNRPLALTHLALSRLAKLNDPFEAARQVLLADALMSNGVSPEAITAALTLTTANEAAPAAKYGPDQPRVPAGSAGGGQWTSSDGAAALASVQNKQPDGKSDRRIGSEVALRSKPPVTNAGNFVTHVNLSCDEVAESDLAICRSAIFSDDPHFHGQCMSGMLRRMEECAAGIQLSPLLPY